MNLDKWDWICYIVVAAALAFNGASWLECIFVPVLATIAFHCVREGFR